MTFFNEHTLLLSLQRYAELHEMKFVQSSAKDNSNIREIFTDLAANIITAREAIAAAPPKRPETVVLQSKSRKSSQKDSKCSC